MAELLTPFVFVDTSVFESENFFESNRLKQLFRLANEGVFEIVVPELTYHELINRMKKGLRKAKAYLDQNRKEIDDHTRLLRNVDPFNRSFLIPRIKVKEELEKFVTALDESFDFGKVRKVKFDDLPCGPVFERYFKEEPPFQSQKEFKKHEFPDAFAIAAIERWCSETGHTCYALSNDKDIIEYNSKHLIPINDLGDFVDLAVRTKEKIRKKQNIAAVDKIIKEKSFELVGMVTNELEDAIGNAALNLNHPLYEIEEVESWSVRNVEILSYSIIEINDREAKVDVAARFDFEVTAEAIDYNMAYYDKEDNRWWGEEKNNLEIEDSMTVIVNTTVVHHPVHGAGFEEIVIDSIENGQELDLRKYI